MSSIHDTNSLNSADKSKNGTLAFSYIFSGAVQW